MKDLEQAHMLLAMAEKDARALAVMGDAEAVATEIFGLHVQQAVEKGLKAWLCLLVTLCPSECFFTRTILPLSRSDFQAYGLWNHNLARHLFQ
ncbi:MAG: hypothetical protein H7829_13130 [Magnetococcus sp. THC-1_WYH]